LINPINDSYAGPESMFSFSVSDNKAVEFDCSIEIDNTEVQTLYAYEGVNAFQLSADIIETNHVWKVVCTDAVELQGSAEDSFIYDKTPPVITLSSPDNGSAIKDDDIDVIVSDNFEVAGVEYSHDLDSSGWDNGWNTLIITAEDSADNTAVVEFSFYVDRQSPTIEIISPQNNSTLDYHGDFTLVVTDDFDSSIECVLSTSVSDSVSADLNSGEQSVISSLLPLGAFTWSVLCVDDVGNQANTDIMNGVAEDLSGPDIVIDDIDYVTRGSDITVTATITDISGVKDVYAIFEDNIVNLTGQGDVYSGSFTTSTDMSPGDYSVYVYATDVNDRSNNAFDEFTLVENYIITFTIPDSVSPGQEVTVSGSVLKDDSSLVEGNITLTYPDGVETMILNNNSEFVYLFTAPSGVGSYDVKVSYETENYIYSNTQSLSVVAPASQSNSGGGSSGWGWTRPGPYTPPVREETSSDTEDIPESDSGEASASELVTEDEPEVEIPEQGPVTPMAGQATGIFDLLGKSVKWWAILLAAAGLLAGSIYGYRRVKKRKDSGKIDWGDSFN
jgi:hypothetical protein